MIHVHDYHAVYVYGEYEEEFGRRKKYLSCEQNDFDFRFNHYYPQDEFLIKLLTQFEESEHRESLLKIVSSVKDQTTAEYTDDGTSQNVVVKKGITKMEKMDLPNPIELVPKNSFPEVVELLSPYVLRIRDGQEPGFALFSGGIGQYRIEAIKRIKTLLSKELPEDIIIIG